MNVIDQILNEWSFRCHDGVVDINDPKKKAILDEILKEFNVNSLNEGQDEEDLTEAYYKVYYFNRLIGSIGWRYRNLFTEKAAILSVSMLTPIPCRVNSYSFIFLTKGAITEILEVLGAPSKPTHCMRYCDLASKLG
jgi:hypothetical protein